MRSWLREKWLSVMMVLLGNFLYAFTVAAFILPSRVMSCGTTGIALILQHLFNVPVPPFVLVFNVFMLAVGRVILGRQFAMTTALSSLIYPVFLQLWQIALCGVNITDNLLLNVLFGGMGLGMALAIVIRAGASTGGMDIPPLVLKRFFGVPVPVSLWAFDFLILLGQLFFHTPEDLLYGILMILIISITMNKVLQAGTSRTEVKIVSERSSEIRQAILSRVDRGVTVLHGEGGYLGTPTEVLLSIVSNHELPRLERMAREIDPDCFMIISQVTEVWGRGFSNKKKYAKK